MKRFINFYFTVNFNKSNKILKTEEKLMTNYFNTTSKENSIDFIFYIDRIE